MRRRALSTTLVFIALVACGADPEPRATTTPVASPSPTEPAAAAPASVPAPAPAPAPAVALPYALPSGHALPADGTPERALIDRWARLAQLEVDALDGFSFRAERALPMLYGGSLVVLTGSDARTPRPEGAVVTLVDAADGDRMAPDAGRTLLLALDTSGDAPEIDDARAHDEPPAAPIALQACRDAAIAAGARCEDGVPALARSLLAIPDAGDATRALFALLGQLGATRPSTDVSFEIVGAAADVPRPLARGARFVPFAATRHAGGLHASGSRAEHRTCASRVSYTTFELEVTPERIALRSRPLAVQLLTGRCL